ncbi:LIM/homeobox protein Lhx9 [Polyplax serrata]|uniref:LIM/homeobox protein Lhx9 n=1 Tax=Polyplax serrata TaxID=468196 RepID=A0AAN8PNZ0_POLSC
MLKDRDAMGPVARAASPCPSGGESATCPAACAGCGSRILDRYYLLAVDRQWHSPCLKCCECKLPLDTELTCFARDGNIYCKEDYYRLFAIKRCNRCQMGISASELVMRAKDMVFHLNCFTCTSCGIPLSKGDHFGMRNGLVYCHPHYEYLCSHDPYCGDQDVFRAGGSPADFFGGGGGERGSGVQKGRPRKRKLQTPIDSSPGSDLNVSLRLPTATLELICEPQD